MRIFRGWILIVVLLVMMFTGAITFAQDGSFATNTPQAAVVDEPGEVVSQDDIPTQPVTVDSGLVETITGQVLLFASAAVIVVGVVVVVVFVVFVRNVIPALKVSVSPEWAPILFPVLDGAEAVITGAAIDLAKRLEARAKETATPLDDELIARILGLLDPPPTIAG